MPTEHQVVPCLACGSTHFDPLLTPEQVEEERQWLQAFHEQRVQGSLKDKAEFTQAEPVFVMRCQNCRTLIRNPQPTPESLRRIYRFDEYGRQTLQDLLETERAFFQAKAATLDLPTGAHVLEIGSFVGAFLLAAKENGWKATGIDIGKETTAFTQSLGLDVREGDVLNLDIKGPFDAICIWNTFDQINEPVPLLQRLHELLKPAATLVLRIPNGDFKSACEEASTKKPERIRIAQAYNNFLAFPYLCGYTPASITSLLSNTGFEVKSITGDVILPLAGKDTKPCAVAEELHYKRLVKKLCHQTKLHPWLDIVATKG